MLINGFEIEEYNQYNLQDGTKYSTCPLCSQHRKPKNQKEKCLMLDWERGLGTCQHCGEVIQLHTYKKRKEVKEYKRPEKWNNTDLSDKVVKWFSDRGISQFTLRMMKVSEGKEWMPQTQKEENTIQFNYFESGELVNIKYRDGRKNFKLFKDAKLVFYNLDAITISKDVVIVEGEMDALAFWEAGIHNVVSTPNGSTLRGVNLEYLDNCIEYFDNKEKIYLALDNDEAGKNVTKELVRRLGAERCFLVDFNDYKDANEVLVKEGKEYLCNLIVEAKEIPIEGVSSLFDFEKDYDEFLINGYNSGYVCGKKSFDSIFSTYTGQYIVVTGIPSSGKSDWVDEMCIGYYMENGWKTAFASPENKPNPIHVSKLEAKIVGQWVRTKSQITQMWHKKAKEIINDNFKFIDLDSYDLDIVLERAKRLIVKFGIKVLVIDPYNKVRLNASLNKNVNEYTNDYLIRIDEFARKNDILIILVAHPTKPSNEERKTYEPDFYSIKGGGEFYDMSPHGILVHRDYENSVVKIKVLKVKFAHLGKNREYVYYKWNTDNGRYIDYENQDKNPLLLSGIRIDNSNWITNTENSTEQKEMLFTPSEEDFYKPVTDHFGNDNLPF